MTDPVTGSLASVGALLLAIGSAPGPAPAVTEFTFADARITESSGLVIDGDLAYTVNDSGDSARVFAVSRTTGETVGVSAWDHDVVDVEALAPAGPGEVWVGDIGGNIDAREVITLSRVPVGEGDRTVEADTYEVSFPDPPGPTDAETLLADPTDGSLLVVTKNVFGGQVFRVPRPLDAARVAVLEPVTSPAAVLGLATDGAILPGGEFVVLRNYQRAAVYRLDDWSSVGDWRLPGQQQGEGLAADADTVWLSSEGANTAVLRQPMPASVLEAMAAIRSPGATPQGADAETPAEAAGEVQGSRWPWFAGIAALVVACWVLMRSLRPPDYSDRSGPGGSRSRS